LLGCCVPFSVADNVIVGDCRLGFCWRWCGAEVLWLCAKTWVRGVEDDAIPQSVFTAKPALDRAKHQFSDPRKMPLGAIALPIRA
jgi:hypothetical protein